MSTPPPYVSFATFARTEDRFLLSVLCKRTYRWTPSGEVSWADEQAPITQDIQLARRDDRNCEVVVQGRDAWPLKQATDVVVTGHAHAAGGAPVPQLEVGVRIGQHQRQIVAIGPRFVEYRGSGQLAFSPPEAFTSVEVSWWNAYGGIDPMVLPLGIKDTPAFAGKPTLELFPGAYPRNPCGIGYMIADTPHLLEGLALPLLEAPMQRLTPDNFLVRDARQWWRQPPPAGFGWCHSLWFPRILQCGGKPYHMPPAPGPGTILNEFALGSVSASDLGGSQPQMTPRLSNEAAPELTLPFLGGNEGVVLRGFSPRGEQGFRLPEQRPRVRARVDGVELGASPPFLHSLVIDADRREFYLLSSTRFVLEDDISADLSDGEPIDEIFPRCVVAVDGRPLQREEFPQAEDQV